MFYPEYIDPHKLMTNDDVFLLFKIIEKHGGVLRFIGGAVRDAISGYKNSDIDLVTDLSPSEISDICVEENLKCIPIGIQFFTLGVFINNSFFKITSLAKKEDDTFDAWKNDAAKRDLTINAIYADDKGNVFDYYNGIEDLRNGVVKFIGKPLIAIESDPIRIMRFFRFCAMFGKKIDRKSLKCCIENKYLLRKTSREKISKEFFKILVAPYASRCLELVFKYSVLDFLITPPKSLSCIEKLDNIVCELDIEKNVIRRLFILFKPNLKRAERLSTIFKLTKKQKDYLFNLCRADIKNKDFKDSVTINKIIYKYGKDICYDMFLYLNLENTNIDEMKKTLDMIKSLKQPTFPLNGKDLLSLGTNKRLIGFYLDVLRKEWLEHDCSLSKQDLITKFLEQIK